MASVKGIKEKVHLPIYDSVAVEPEQQLRKVESSGTLKFFVNVQGKTKLETNLQAASLLPHYNTFEARAMRVVIADLPPEFPEDPTADDEDFDVTNEAGLFFDGLTATPLPTPPTTTSNRALAVTAQVELGVKRLAELYQEAKDSEDGTAVLDVDDEDVTLVAPGPTQRELTDPEIDAIAAAGGTVDLTIGDLDDLIDQLGRDAPPKEQLSPNNGAGTLIGKIIYNTVTTIYVGEKVMIEMPTWFFPAGAGPYSETGRFTTHGEPSPTATFRFAEPIFIDRQQNFRVEIEIPDAETLKEIQQAYGPMFIWVVLDGYMTRDVQ
jgi:hypothetical protein